MTREQTPFRSLSRAARRERIAWAAREVFMEKGLDEASMDDVAACAGTTKPTVYAHFKSKDELFSAVLELIEGLFLGHLGSPGVYAAEPVAAVALYCGPLPRTHERAGSGRLPTLHPGRRLPEPRRRSGGVRLAVHRGLAPPGRLSSRARADRPSRAGSRNSCCGRRPSGPVFRRLYGVDEPSENHPGEEAVGSARRHGADSRDGRSDRFEVEASERSMSVAGSLYFTVK